MQVETFSRGAIMQYARVCGFVLAQAHAGSGQPAMLRGYLGKSDKFDQAIADFAVAYADQSERDQAQGSGRHAHYHWRDDYGGLS